MKNSASAPRIFSKAVPGILGFLLLTLPVTTGRAQSTYTWDSDATAANGATDGGGAWDTTTANWYSGGNDAVWSNASPYNNAVFGNGGTGGTIAIDSSLYASTLTFDNSGYVLTGSALYLQSAATSGTTALNVAAGVSAEIDSLIAETGVSSSTLTVATGGTLTLGGGSTFNTLALGATTGGTINLNGGTFGSSILNVNTTVVQGASTVNTGTLQVGLNGSSASYTINSASAVLKDTGVLTIGRGPTGTFDLKQGTVTVGGSINLGFNHPSTLTVEGGSLTMTGTGTSGLLYINYGATTANYAATANLSGGTLTVGGIQFGQGTTAYGTGTSGTLNVTGGTLYIGSSGIVQNSTAPASNTISLSGGTVGATANWSSSMAMALGGAGRRSRPPTHPGRPTTSLSAGSSRERAA